MQGKQFTDLTKASVLKDSDIFAVHDGNGLKKSSMGDLTAYMSDKFSNPNLLINPDFKINQRGESAYNSQYSVDRWKIYNALYNVSTKNLSNSNSSDGNLVQTFENPLNGTYTITVHCSSVTGIVNFTWSGENVIVDKEVGNLKKGNNIVTIKATNLKLIGVLIKPEASVNIDYIKLEQGSIATPFVAPNPAEELVKCQRYYYRSKAYKYGVVPDGKAWVVEILTQDFRIKPTLEISTTYESHINKKEQRVTSIGNKYVISLKLISTDNVLDSYALETEIKIDAEIY